MFNLQKVNEEMQNTAATYKIGVCAQGPIVP